MRVLQPSQRLLQVWPPGPQHHQLRPLRRQPPGGLDDQVHALLVVEPADKDKERRVGLFGQTQLALQRPLARRLALFEVCDGVLAVSVLCFSFLFHQKRVAAGAPLPRVDAVDDARELAVASRVPQDVVEAPPPFGRLHLPRVPSRDRHDAVRSLDPGLQDVGVLASHGVVEIEGRAALPGRHGVEVRVGRRPPPLVRRVVQHQHGPRILVLPVVPVVRLEHDREQGRVPVVGDEDEVVLSVDDAAAGDDARGLEGGLGEEGAPEGDV